MKSKSLDAVDELLLVKMAYEVLSTRANISRLSPLSLCVCWQNENINLTALFSSSSDDFLHDGLYSHLNTRQRLKQRMRPDT